jgi:hypothetical protein
MGGSVMDPFEKIPIAITHDPIINMRPDLRDCVMKWVVDGIESGLEMAEGGFCLDDFYFSDIYPVHTGRACVDESPPPRADTNEGRA